MRATVIRRLTGVVVVQCGDETHPVADLHTPLGATFTCPAHPEGSTIPPLHVVRTTAGEQLRKYGIRGGR